MKAGQTILLQRPEVLCKFVFNPLFLHFYYIQKKPSRDDSIQKIEFSHPLM